MHEAAAVDDDRLAGDQPGIVADDERDQVGQVLWLTALLDCLRLHRLVEDLFTRELRRPWRRDLAGHNRVHADALGAQLACEYAGHTDDRAFTGDVAHLPGRRREERARCYVDD